MLRPILLFDLDGTLIDSVGGITRCVAHALTQLDHPVPSAHELRRWIGPPLRASFTWLLREPLRVEAAIAHYRDRYENHGWAEHEVYPGIGATIDALYADGHRLAVAPPSTNRTRARSSDSCRSPSASRTSSAPAPTATSATSPN